MTFRLKKTIRAPLLTAILSTAWMATAGCPAPEAQRIGGDIAETLETAFETGTESFDHTAWNKILEKHVRQKGRRFDYAGLKKEESKLDEYLEHLARVDLATLAPSALKALFINAYNAYTVQTVLERVSPGGTLEIASIRDIPNVFEREAHVVGGFTLSLDHMEHNILRPYFKDPRVHFAVNCASASCPPLPPQAFEEDTVDRQLEEAAREVLRDPDYVRVEDDQLLVTRIMDWYRSDFISPEFEGAEESLPAFIRKYTREEVREWIDSREGTPNVAFMPYDWSLNRASPPSHPTS